MQPALQEVDAVIVRARTSKASPDGALQAALDRVAELEEAIGVMVPTVLRVYLQNPSLGTLDRDIGEKVLARVEAAMSKQRRMEGAQITPEIIKAAREDDGECGPPVATPNARAAIVVRIQKCIDERPLTQNLDDHIRDLQAILGAPRETIKETIERALAEEPKLMADLAKLDEEAAECPNASKALKLGDLKVGDRVQRDGYQPDTIGTVLSLDAMQWPLIAWDSDAEDSAVAPWMLRRAPGAPTPGTDGGRDGT